MKKIKTLRPGVFLALISIIFQAYGIGLKIVKPLTAGVLQDLMPWEIATSGDWTYIASDEGLVEYDGSEPLLFSVNNGRPLRSVTIDEETGRIYVGGISEFGYFISSPYNSLDYVCLSDSIGSDRHIGNIWGIHPQKDILIVQGDNAIIKYDLIRNKHEVIKTTHKLDMSADVEGVVWLGTDDGLKLLLGSNIVDVPEGHKLKGKRIRKILPYEEGFLVVTTEGLWKYKNQHLVPLPQYDNVFKKMKVAFSADIFRETLALGSVSYGLATLDLKNGKYQVYDEVTGLPSNTVISLKFDDRGELWTGLQFGLARVALNRPIESINNGNYAIGSGYVMNRMGNDLYLGTNRGLFKIGIDPLSNNLLEKETRVDNLRGQVWGLTLIDGELFCSMDQGLYIIRPGKTAERISDIRGIWDVKRQLGSKDRLYVGTYDGLKILKKNNGSWNEIVPVEGYQSSLYNFVQEKDNIIWNDNAEEGIDRIVIDPLTYNVKEIRNFQQTQDGTPLTSEIFLSRIDNDIYFSTKNGVYLYDAEKDAIVKDREINKLLGNPKNIKRVKKSNGGLIALTETELLQADPAGILEMKRTTLSPGSSRPMHEGDLFFPVGNDYMGFPTKNGYLLFDFSPESDSLWQTKAPEVRISTITVSNMGDSVIFKGNFRGEKYEPVLTHHENSIRIAYGSREDLENGILYSTRLNQEPWTTPSKAMVKEMTDLKPGRYNFEVKALSPDGQEASDNVSFRITPPWWKTNWMVIIYAIFLISFIFIMIRFEQLRVERKHQIMLKEKNREIELQEEKHKKETEEKDRQIEELEREKLEKDIKHKSQELANVMMSLSHKNDTLQTVKRELQNILSLVHRTNTDARKAISELQGKVVVDIQSDDILKRVEEEFDIVHDSFMKKLRQQYPDLNNNEILLCAYLKMNLSTKEIAPLLNISSRGVETMRYRLRKKLGLDRDASLSSFILSFS